MKALLCVLLIAVSSAAFTAPALPEPFISNSPDYYLFETGDDFYMPVAMPAEMTSLIMRHPIGGLMG